MKRSSKATTSVMDADCCGQCAFYHQDKTDESFKCWVDPPYRDGDDWIRGRPTESFWPKCHKFTPRVIS